MRKSLATVLPVFFLSFFWLGEARASVINLLVNGDFDGGPVGWSESRALIVDQAGGAPRPAPLWGLQRVAGRLN